MTESRISIFRLPTRTLVWPSCGLWRLAISSSVITLSRDEIAGASVRDFDALVLPGGVANPDTLRTNKDAVALVRAFMEADKPVAAICHAPWLLVEADAVRGRTITSWPSLETDIKNAGGAWVDKAVQLDQKLLTSRNPDDLPGFCAQLVSLLSDAIDERRLDKMVEQSFPASDPLPGPISIV